MGLLRRIDPATTQGSLPYFVLSFLAILATLLSVVDMLTLAWASSGLSYQLVVGPILALTLSPALFLYVPLGVYLGLVLALALDSYKSTQGLLFAFALLVTLAAYYVQQVVVEQAFTFIVTELGVVLALVVAVATLRVVGVTTDSIRNNVREYPRAPSATMLVTGGLCLIGFLEAHLVYQTPIVATPEVYRLRSFAFDGIATAGLVQHLLASVILVGALRYFTAYERGLRIIMIGPARSGKSAIFGGLHLYIRDHVDELGEAAFRLNRLRSSIESGEFPDATQMAVQSGSGPGRAEGQPSLLALPYSWGQFFPRRVNFHAIDYPGEALEEILATVVQKAERQSQRIEGIRSDGGRPSGSDSESGEDDEFDVPFSDEDEGESSDPLFSEDVDRDRDQGLDAEPPDPDRVRSRPGFHDEDTGLFESDGTDGESRRLFPIERLPFAGGTDRQRDPMESWKAATDTIRAAENIDEMIPGIRGCIDNADRIVLTLPLDDYVAPVIHRGNVPSYLEDKVLSMDELDQYPPTDVRTFEYEGEQYAIRQPFQRAAPEDYLYWYQALRNVYRDTDFVIVGTMADWMLEDFEAVRGSTRSVLAEDYDAFCEHVLEEVVREQTPMINQIFGGRNKGRLYLLWYEMANEDPPGLGEELRIDTEGPYTVLKGAEQFVDRIHQ